MLLWALISATYTALFARTMTRRVSQNFWKRTLAFLGIAGLGVNLFVATLSSPFAKIDGPVPLDGKGLNPLLQDVGLAIHPPVLYLGYVGLVIPYALAMGALLTRTHRKDWAAAVKPWVYIPLGFLSLGIVLGSWWAYRELGWGGWWFWDPVENASLFPWLVAIALAHSVMALSTRGGLGTWSMALAVLAFGMSILGTFLVRSGNLVSVHAFASDPGRGIAILSYLTLIVGGGLILLALRAKEYQGPDYDLVSRDGVLLAHNLLIMAITVTIILGTVYPPIIEALNQPPLAVGAPFYHATVVPLMIVALVFMAIGPELPWKKAKLSIVMKHSITAIILGFVAYAMALFLFDASIGATSSGISVFLIVLSARMIKRSISKTPNRSRLPMGIAHLAAGVFALSATLSNVFAIEADRPLRPGESFQERGYTVTLNSLKENRGPNYIYVTADVSVSNDGNPPVKLTPEYRFYPARDMPTTEADIHTSPLKDLRASLNMVEGDGPDSRRWALRFHMRPAMVWVWLSTVFGAFGLFLAARNSWRDLPKELS